MEIFKLFGSVLIDSDAAEKSIAKTGDSAEGLSGKLVKGIDTAAKWGAGIAVGAGVAIGGMAALIGKTLETTSEISKFAQVTGMSNKGFQEWDSVMKTFGYSAEAAAGDLAALAEKAMDAQSGIGENADIFKELGVSVEDASGKLKTQEQLFNETVAGLQGMEDVTRRNALATAFLSTTGEELAPILNMTNEELAAMKANANVISDADIAKAEEFRIGWENVKSSFSGIITEIGIKLMPVFEGLIAWVTDNMPLIQSTSEKVFNAISDVIIKISKYINDNVVPAFQALYDWIQPKIPEIKETISKAFDAIEGVFGKVKDAVKFLYDNMNILIPIVTGLTGAIVAQMIINSLVGAYKAWQAATKTQTALQWLLNIALNANPLGLVALAIGAVIAIGILLWKNWDTIKAKTLDLWKMITSKFTDIKNSVVAKVEELKVQAVSKFVQLIRASREKFLAVKEAIMTPINEAKDRVKGAIETIKGFFTGLKLKLPKIKVPSFSLKNWSKNPLDWIGNMPSIGINWNAAGGIFSKPTVFNTSAGLQGVGEGKDAEAILPLNKKVLGDIGRGIADTMQTSKQPIILQTILNGRIIAEEIHDDIGQLMGGRNNLTNAMRGV